MASIEIAPSVALNESQALVEYYRNRSMLQAQAIADLQAEIQSLKNKEADNEPADEL